MSSVFSLSKFCITNKCKELFLSNGFGLCEVDRNERSEVARHFA